MIIGHADSGSDLPSRNNHKNWALGANRAESVRQTLICGGVDASKVIGTSSMGDRAPLSGYKPTDPMNRRVDLLVLSLKSEKQIDNQWNLLHGVDEVITSYGLDSAVQTAEANQAVYESF